MSASSKIEIQPIGIIHTPYEKGGFAPNQPVEREQGEARLELDPRYAAGLKDLESFRYVYVLSWLHAGQGASDMEIRPDWVNDKDKRVGLFASRSPDRPVPIGLSVVRLKRIEENVVVTSLLDVFDGTPLLDLKPYIAELDAKADANYGWISGLDGHKHLLDHVRGIPHAHHEHHHHDHDHD